MDVWRVVGKAAAKSKAQGARLQACLAACVAAGGGGPAPGPWPAGAWTLVCGSEATSLRRALAGPVGGVARPYLGAIVDVWGAPPPAWLQAPIRASAGTWLWARAEGPQVACAMVEALLHSGKLGCVVVRGLEELSGLASWPAGSRGGVPALLQHCRSQQLSLVATCSVSLEDGLCASARQDGAGLGPRGQAFAQWASVRVQT